MSLRKIGYIISDARNVVFSIRLHPPSGKNQIPPLKLRGTSDVETTGGSTKGKIPKESRVGARGASTIPPTFQRLNPPAGNASQHRFQSRRLQDRGTCNVAVVLITLQSLSHKGRVRVSVKAWCHRPVPSTNAESRSNPHVVGDGNDDGVFTKREGQWLILRQSGSRGMDAFVGHRLPEEELYTLGGRSEVHQKKDHWFIYQFLPTTANPGRIHLADPSQSNPKP